MTDVAETNVPAQAVPEQDNKALGQEEIDPVNQETIEGLIEKATASLKSNRDKILNEKKQLAEKLKFLQDQYAGLSPQDVKDAELRIRTLEEGNAQLQQQNQKAQRLLMSLSFDKKASDVALKRGVRPEALQDVIARARNSGWRIGDSGKLELHKEGSPVLDQQGTSPMTFQIWLDSLNKQASHLFSESQGGGAVSQVSRPAVVQPSIMSHSIEELASGKVSFS